jgi:hypothetical protein
LAWAVGKQIEATTFDLLTQTWGASLPIGTTEGNPDWVSIHQDAQGRALAIWSDYYNSQGQLWFARFE